MILALPMSSFLGRPPAERRPWHEPDMANREGNAVDVTPRSYQALEVGSGPGVDARYLEQHGLDVLRTDATPAFVEMMREAGHQARLLDIRTDDVGGPWKAVLAQAVLLHLDREQFTHALQRIRHAMAPSGVLALTMKEGDGDAWTDAKLDLPRRFTYWREQPLRDVLA